MVWCAQCILNTWLSKCMDLRPGLVVIFGWQSCSTDRGRLGRSIERHVNYGGRAEEHSQIKNSQHAPQHMHISLPLFSYTSSPFFFSTDTLHTDQLRDTNRTVVTPSVFTQSCLLARMKRSHWHIGWMDGRWWQDGWQAPSPGKQTHGYVGINRNDKQTSMDILMVIFKAHTDRWRHYCKQSPITICDNLQSKPHLG